MIVDQSIFKAYDIRGVYGETLNEEIATAIGGAFIKVVQPGSVVVGRDGRVSSPSLHEAIVESLLAAGVNVIDIGMVSTDMYYFACATHELPGIMVTASHNPKQYNGFKMVRKIPDLLSGDTGIMQMYEYISQDSYHVESETRGTLRTEDVMPAFIQKMLSLVDVSAIKPMKIIADTANGMVGPSLRELFKALPQLDLVEMYFEVDGTFPNHGGDPLQAENRAELQERVPAEGADLGVAFDPDGDRFFCIDKTGRFVSGDFMTALLAQHFLKRSPGADIIYDIRASHAVPDLITQAGGTAHYNRVGHAYIKARMLEENGIFGGEVTGHYYFKDFYYCDSGIAPLLFLLEMLSQATESLDQMLDRLEAQYFISGEINTKGVDAQAVFAELEATYGPNAQEVLHVDGVSVVFPEWHFNVRASNTEPLVRLNLEATSAKLMEEKKAELLAVITKHKTQAN